MSNASTQSMLNRAQLLLEQNRLSEAREIYRKICVQEHKNDAAWMMLGNLNGALGDIVEAEKCCRNAIELNPQMVNAHANLGNALMAQNRFTEAASSFLEATDLQPDLAPAWFMLGKAKYRLGLWLDAEVAFRKAVEFNPAWTEACLLLGNVLQFMGRFHEAVQQYEILIQNQVDHSEAYYRLAVSLSSMGKIDEAEACCRSALKLQPDYISALNSLSMILTSQGRTDEALKCCNRVLKIKPDDINAACMAANIYEQSGDVHKAYKYLRPHVETGRKHLNLALAFAAVSKELGFYEQAIVMMEDLLDHAHDLTNTGRRNLCFMLGKLCDATRQYDRAFGYYQRGNELRPTAFNQHKYKAEIDASIRIQSADFFTKMPKSSNKSERPIFIVGMPRSGTSLVEQVLASHPDMYGAGELSKIGGLARSLVELLSLNKPYPEIIKYVSDEVIEYCADQYLQYINDMDSDSLRVIDKMPGNYFYLGFIELLFPNARIIHCMRNPLDSCLSCYFQDFFQNMDWCYDQENLAAYYRGYEKLMNHWKQVLNIPIMDIHYEDLVEDQEKVSRELVEFCALDWTDDCLQFHKTKRFVPTASYDQVRKPIYKKSVARWRNYEQYIGPLKKELNRYL